MLFWVEMLSLRPMGATPVEANAMWDDKLTMEEVYGTLCANKQVLILQSMGNEVKRATFCQQPM